MRSSAVLAELVFAHTPTYPDEPPLVKARSQRGLADADVASLQALVDGQVEENLGMPMIYTLITAAQEWITEQAAQRAAPVVDPEAERKRREAEEEARIAELRRHGTPVTPETFTAWKARFEAEKQLANASVVDAAAAAVSGKLTGKQWFLQHEAQHIDIEEPDLEDDEEDGEDSRSQWSGEGPAVDEADLDDLLGSSDEDEDAMLEQMLAGQEGG